VVIISAFDYKESIISVRRKGDDLDPFIPVSQMIMIKNGLVQLSEIPDIITKVTVTSDDDIWFEVTGDESPQGTEYKVSYLHGYVEFHPSNNGKSLNFSFLGSGNIFISAERVWVESDGTTVTKTLGDIIEAGKEAIENLEQVQEVIDEANAATDAANNAASSANAINTSIQESEDIRITAEEDRVMAENARNANEIIRQDNESLRITGEDARILAEDDRELSEDQRNQNELERDSAEEIRISNEDDRISSENTRQFQETQRQSNTSAAITSIETVRDSLVHLGQYSSSTTYQKNNEVRYNGSSWRCLQTVTGVIPSEGSYWTLSASKGLDGMGSVVSVNDVSPDNNGNVVLTPSDIGAVEISLSEEAPTEVNLNSWWYEDLGETLDLGGGGVAVLNASLDGSSDLWFDEI